MKALLLVFLIPISAFAETAKVSVNGMVCAFCAQGIKKKFSAQAAVENTEVDLDSKIVTVKIREGKQLSDEAISGLIKDAGYAVVKIEREGAKAADGAGKTGAKAVAANGGEKKAEPKKVGTKP
jgi:mercuric ion binding protein